MTALSRRTLLTGAIAGAGAIAFARPASASAPTTGPALVGSGRLTLPSGIQSG